MLTTDQQKWINHLSDENKIEIKPYDSSCNEKFEKVKNKIQKNIGKEVKVKHCGATNLRISGQDEIDVYIPVSENNFDELILKLTQLFGEARSHYPLKRVRFVTEVDKKHVDIFLINEDSDDWINSVKFENYLRKNPNYLEKYKNLKEKGNGLSVREYYRRKIEFINKILEKAKEVSYRKKVSN